MEIIIKRAAIVSSLFLSYDFELTDSNAKNNSKTKSDAPIHEDLRNAFRALIPHFAFMCEEITDEDLILDSIKNMDKYFPKSEDVEPVYPQLLKYNVHEISFSGKGDNEKLKISGTKRLENLKYITFSAPEIYTENTNYIFNHQLQEAVSLLKTEVLSYMVEGKQAPKTQIEMFIEEEVLED